MLSKLRILLIAWALVVALAVPALAAQGPQSFYVELLPVAISGGTIYNAGTTTAQRDSSRAGVSTLYIKGMGYTSPTNPGIFVLGTMARYTTGASVPYEPSITKAGSGASVWGLASTDTVINVAELGTYGSLQVIGVSPSVAEYVKGAASYSGVSVEVGYYGTALGVSEPNYATMMERAERVPIWVGVLSGDSTSPVSFEIPPYMRNVRFYARAGVSAIGNLHAQVTLGVPTGAWKVPAAIHLGTRVYGPLGIAGSSSFASADSYGDYVPDGARYGLMKSADSGNSLFMSASGAVQRDRDPALQAGDVMPIEGSLAELQRRAVGAAVANVKAIVQWFTKKPF